jgi:hypothetical protein
MKTGNDQLIGEKRSWAAVAAVTYADHHAACACMHTYLPIIMLTFYPH